jgi:hypothetical protein
MIHLNFANNLPPRGANMPAFGRKSEILSPKSSAGCLTAETDRMDAKRYIPAHFKECDLKKQSQFARGLNECKYNYNK